MAKMGRPKAEQPKEKMVAIRLTEEEHQRIIAYATAHNKTVTQILHEKIGDIIADESAR